MIKWINEYGKEESGNLIAIDFLMQQGVIMSDPAHLRHVMDKRQKNYPKDLALAYKHFLHILGTGLVTSSGENWKRQRRLSSPIMRIDIIQETTEVAKRAVDRLSAKLEAARGTGKPVEIAEEFRIMTLQVIYGSRGGSTGDCSEDCSSSSSSSSSSGGGGVCVRARRRRGVGGIVVVLVAVVSVVEGCPAIPVFEVVNTMQCMWGRWA